MQFKQLDFFEETGKKDSRGMVELKTIDFRSQIGFYKELKDVQGANDLTDKAYELLHYLYTNHARPEDGFIHAKQLAKVLGYYDTRELRKLCAEIDHKTELVVYSSVHGYKLASNDDEMKEAIKFALAPAMTAISRVFAKNKRETLHWLHGFIGNLEKEYKDNPKQGQLQHDHDKECKDVDDVLRTVNHYPEQPHIDYMPSIDERVRAYAEKKKKGIRQPQYTSDDE